MSKRKPTPADRSLRPMAESLETRQLLSGDRPRDVLQSATAVVKGTDPDGAQWTLRLYGPGALSVVGTKGDMFTRVDPEHERVDRHDHRGRIDQLPRRGWSGRSYPNPTGNAHVYFQNLIVTPTGELGKIDVGQVSNFRTVSERHPGHRHAEFLSGAHRHDHADHAFADSHFGACRPGSIYIPQGVNHAPVRRRGRQLYAVRAERR